jgi:catechol 2,3-dioxygenase-like lactoylglutathione lyase family enzyme
MFSHIMVGANKVQESKTFYDAILCAMGHKPEVIDAKGRCFYSTKSGVLR